MLRMSRRDLQARRAATVPRSRARVRILSAPSAYRLVENE